MTDRKITTTESNSENKSLKLIRCFKASRPQNKIKSDKDDKPDRFGVSYFYNLES